MKLDSIVWTAQASLQIQRIRSPIWRLHQVCNSNAVVGKRNRQFTQDCIWRAGSEPPKKAQEALWRPECGNSCLYHSDQALLLASVPASVPDMVPPEDTVRAYVNSLLTLVLSSD